MFGQRGFFDVEDHYKRLIAAGYPLEKLEAVLIGSFFCKPLLKGLK